MAAEKISVSPFWVEEMGAPRPRAQAPAHRNSHRAARGRAKKPGERKWPSSLSVKIGVCALACMMVFAMKALDTPAAAQVVSGVRGAVADEKTDLKEMLGKLEFVEIPDALSVFSSNSDRMALPVSAAQVQLTDDAQYAEWEAAPHAQVTAALNGEVRAVGEDPVMGMYVRLMHSDDVETVYFGLETVSVEQGQPIRKNDTLGALGEAGRLYMGVFKAGAPQSPAEYLDLGV